MKQEDLAVDEPVIEILPGRHCVAEFAMAAGFHADFPAGLEEEYPVWAHQPVLNLAGGGSGCEEPEAWFMSEPPYLVSFIVAIAS